ncbi:hypothetical protein ACG2LH_15565 [Zhouia sp. PK063]|uniref:hypothetical protein n=1 Tax=Zhouia sp. PK063 TaxID=3373602 RepID=UPI0037A97A75
MTIRNWTRVINWIGGLCTIWLLFYPVLYKISVLINILVPIIAILFVYKHQGEVGIDSRKWDNTPLPKIDWAILMPSFSLVLRATLDFEIIGVKRLILFSIIISIPLIVILWLGTKKYAVGKKIFIGFIWASSFIFSFGSGTTIFINVFLDRSKPIIYKSKIISKKIEKGKITSYRIDYEPWGPIKENDLMRVSKNEFEKLHINDSINLKLNHGFLKINWILKK